MKLRTGGWTLIPLLGGVSFVVEPYTTYKQKAFVAIGGPLGGSVLAIIVYVAYLITGIQYLLPSAYFMFFVQLFNLFPLGKILDGAQVLDTITFSISERFGIYAALVSTAIGIILMFFYSPIIAILLAFFGGRIAWQDYKNWQAGITVDRPRKLATNQAAILILTWVGSIAVLTLLMFHIHNQGVNIMDAFRR